MMRLAVAGSALIFLQLLRWCGIGAGNVGFGPGLFYYPMVALFFVFPIVGILMALARREYGAMFGIIGAFLLLNDVRLGLEAWSGPVVVLGGVLSVLDGMRAPRNTYSRDLRTLSMVALAAAVMGLMAWYVVPLLSR